MNLKVFTMYDSKAEAYLQPFFMVNAGMAIRALTEVINDVNHTFCKHAADYTLFEIGTFDDSTSEITMHKAKINLGLALEMKRQDPSKELTN